MEKSWTADYRVGDLIYKIFENSEMHSKLRTDKKLLERYVAESTDNPEFFSVVSADEVDSPGPQIFKWDAKATKYFIEMYNERKNKFRDPKIRKKTLWSEMARDMNVAGYNVDEESLDRKLRNMKKTYKTIKDNNSKNSTGRGRITWEYFDVFEEIFANDRTVNCGPVISSLASTNVCELNMSTSSSCSHSSPILLSENKPPNKIKKTNVAKSMSSLFYMRKKMLEAEERKAAAGEDLNCVLRETNNILKERNELLRRFLETRSGVE